MAKCQDSKCNDRFYAGVVAALAVVALHDNETIFEEIIDSCDAYRILNEIDKNGSYETRRLAKAYRKKLL